MQGGISVFGYFLSIGFGLFRRVTICNIYNSRCSRKVVYGLESGRKGSG